MSNAPKTLQFPAEKLTKMLPCGKCGRDMEVSTRTVVAFCRDCSAGIATGKK
jgi:hypothetical protein